MSKIDWYCQECGRGFRTVSAASRASYNGCPRCGGVDVDLGPPRPVASSPVGYHGEEVDPLRPHAEGCSCGSSECPEWKDAYLEASE